MFVIGTAGHVDHGKSTLIEALTGINPDRLSEEKSRGMTIELGFAWVELPSGREISVVDVPGHERFVKNMLMGAGGIDAALFVIAADEGIMPQTREHIAILDLLNVDRGLVALTKSDLVDDEWNDLVALEVEELLSNSSLRNSKLISVSAQDGTGLDELRQELDVLVDSLPPRSSDNSPRLPVDRAFTISGFGTVVTGTLSDGPLKVGTEVEIQPSGLTGRIRTLQVHERNEETVLPGTRLAVNISGIDHDQISRGDVLSLPGSISSSTAFDAFFRAIGEAPRAVRHNHKVTIFTGTSEVPATVRVLEGDEIQQGKFGWVQIRTSQALPLQRGDMFVVRDTENTLGGGTVLQTQAPRRKRNDVSTIEHLELLQSGSGDDRIESVLIEARVASRELLREQTGVTQDELERVLDELVDVGKARQIGRAASQYAATSYVDATERQVKEILRNFHERYPLRAGIPLQDLRGQLDLKRQAFTVLLETFEANGSVRVDAAVAADPAFAPTLTDAQEAEVSTYVDELRTGGYSPSTDKELPVELLQFIIDRGDIIRLGSGVIYPTPVYDEIESAIKDLSADLGGEISISAVREKFGTSRKYTLAVLENMDSKGLTRRVGDNRFLR
ncbi:MAG: selenocysteine-specific translation elongation factor [Dehalococcoidia bacterium]